jgi:hypothetical protein
MVNIKAQNNILLKSAKFSYLSANYLSGVTSLVLSNSDGFYPYTIGASSTQFDITNTTGTTFRYTYDTTGTDPEIGENIQVNSQVVINGQNFTVANNGTFTVTAFSTNYFEVTNASGVVESNKTLGTGSLSVGRNNFVLLGEFGSETSEIVTVSSVNKSTHTLTLSAATKFSHSQDTKAYVLGYDKVKFFHTTTATFNTTTPISGYLDISADSLYTTGSDAANSTGFGWFYFYNSITAKDSATSNAVPYSSFGENSVKSILEIFYSLLNDKERKLITDTDSLHWLNEAYSIAQNSLNLVNREYFADSIDTITSVSGTAEYDLENDFSSVINIYDETNEKNIEWIDLRNVSSWNYDSNNTTHYYLKGGKIGFSPIPSSAIEYSVRYNYKTTAVSSYYENIDLPNGNFYCVINFMLHRAGIKLGKSDAMNYLKLFDKDIERMKLTSFKQNANLDSWGMEKSSWV